jgi:hypothetical protein
MRAGVGARAACFGLVGNDRAAASCRGYFRGYGMPPILVEELGANAEIEVIRPP